MRQRPCPHCFEKPVNLDMHLRFECPKLLGRSRYVEPAKPVVSLESVLPQFFEDIEKFLGSV